jgi:diguanylate cyclase (GGDEF)-like protein/PAS domain S-box-containing protein
MQVRPGVALLLASCGAAAAVFVLATVTDVLPLGLRQPVADLLLAAVALGTGLLVHRASRRGDPVTHLTWRFAGYAMLAWGVGQLCFGLENLATGDVQRPGASDVGFLVAVVFAVRAAVAFPTVAGSRTGRGRALLDGSVVAGCALLLTWLLVLAAPGATAEPLADWGLLLAYPLVDCLIVTVLVSAAVRLPRERAVPVSLGLAGMLVLLITSLVTFTLNRTGQLGNPEPAEVGYLLCFALVGLGALLQSGSRPPAARVTGLFQQLLPFLGVPPVVLALLVHSDRLTPGSVTLTVLLAVLLLVRQVLVIAENDQLNAALIDRGRRYEALVQGSADLTVVIHPSGVVSDASPSVDRLLGDVRGRPWTELVSDEDVEALRLDLAGCLGRPDGITTRFRLPGPDGDVHVDARLTDLTSRPEVGGIVVNARDVTDRWQTQRALEDSERRYRQMAETAAEGLAVIDPSGILRFANRRLAEVIGRPVDELVGRSENEILRTLVDEAGLAVLREQNAERRAGRSSTYDLVLQRPDGRTSHVRLAATPLYDAAGSPEGSMALVTDITAQVELEHRLQRDALTDHLTGLGNRRALVEAVPARLAGRPLALLYVDLDDFKAVNDSRGHAVGDLLLREVARRLQGCVREQDLVVRLGGDEFAAVLVDEDDEQRAVSVAERVLEVLDAPVRIAGVDVRVGASIGVALSTAEELDAVASLLHDADTALYAAKAGGRGRVRTTEPPGLTPAQRSG